MTLKPIDEIAKELAEAHRKEDPTTTVFQAEDPHEIHLVEVSKSVATAGEILPFRFNAQQPDVPYASVVILLSEEEWEHVKQGKLALPPGWDKDSLKKIA